MLTGLPVTSTDTAMAAARQLIEKGCKNWVVITLGSEGAVFLGRNDPSKATLVPAPKVQALDTTVSCSLACVDLVGRMNFVLFYLIGSWGLFLGGASLFYGISSGLVHGEND